MIQSNEPSHDIPISKCRDTVPAGDGPGELLALAQRRKLVRELRRSARRCADEAWLLERAIDGALALRILEALESSS